MRSIDPTKKQEQDKLASDVERWIAKGGTVDAVPPGATAGDRQVQVIGRFAFPIHRFPKKKPTV